MVLILATADAPRALAQASKNEAERARVTEDEFGIKIETDKLEAVIPKKKNKQWMTGIEKQSFRDKVTGFRELGDGLMVVDWLMEAGSDEAYQDQILASQGTPGIGFLKRDLRQTRVAAYQYVFKYSPEAFGGISRAAFLGGLEMEGIPCDGLFYEPVYRSALFPVDPSHWPALSWGRIEPLDLRGLYRCPVSERAAYEESVWLPHHLFLGGKKDADDIADAVRKVCENISELRGLKHPAIERKSMSRAERPRIEKRQY